MGRAKRDITAIAVSDIDLNGFDKAFGNRRGVQDSEQLRQRTIAQAGDANEQANWENMLEVINDPANSKEPRVQAMITDLTKSVVKTVAKQHYETTKQVADSTSVRRVNADHVIREIVRVDANKFTQNPVFHIWPDGHDHKDPSSAGQIVSLCGLEMVTSPKIRARRGVWREVAADSAGRTGYTLCKTCEQSAHLYEDETTEGFDFTPLAPKTWDEFQAALARRIDGDIRSGKMHKKETLTEYADSHYQEQLMQTMEEVMNKDRSWYVQQTMPRKKYRAMVRDAHDIGWQGDEGDLLGETGVRKTLEWAFSAFNPKFNTMSTSQGMEVGMSYQLRKLREKAAQEPTSQTP